VRELSDETLKKIAHELTENLRKNLTVDWSERQSVRAKLRLMVKRILRKYRYPPDLEVAAVELVLQQAQVLGEAGRRRARSVQGVRGRRATRVIRCWC
jgi:type I restriction enzyme R subunit